MPLKFFGETDPDPGEWFLWREEGGEKIEVKVRRIPPSTERSIEFRHFGRKRKVTFSRKGAVQDLDVEKQDEVNREKAAECMVETRGFELELAGDSAAQEIGKALGTTLEAGQVVGLDGKWSDELKAAVFSGLPDLVEWLGEKATSLSRRDEREDEEAQGN